MLWKKTVSHTAPTPHPYPPLSSCHRGRRSTPWLILNRLQPQGFAWPRVLLLASRAPALVLGPPWLRKPGSVGDELGSCNPRRGWQVSSLGLPIPFTLVSGGEKAWSILANKHIRPLIFNDELTAAYRRVLLLTVESTKLYATGRLGDEHG